MAFNPHEYLNSLTNFEAQLHKLGPADFLLTRIQKFLDWAGNPHRGLKIIHVAGTKGKGSTCAFLGRILQEAGYTVGLYTSPHLITINERIRILRPQDLNASDQFSGSITDDELGIIVNSLRPHAAKIINEGYILTFFEVLTVAALVYFSKEKVDVVILETGLGGRLDATNAVESLIAVITPISLDHTKILGDTLDKIAFEKAGIIKNTKQKVVLAPQEQAAMQVLLERCKEFGIQPVCVDTAPYQEIKIGLKGRHQVANAATAVETAKILRILDFKISDEVIILGLKNVRWRGRFEILRKSPDLIIDGAHNDASARALAETLAAEYPQRKVILILGISNDKDINAICKYLKMQAMHVILTKANHPRSYTFTKEEAKNFFGNKPVEIVDDVKAALARALELAGPQDVILATGSIFIAAEVATCINTKA